MADSLYIDLLKKLILRDLETGGRLEIIEGPTPKGSYYYFTCRNPTTKRYWKHIIKTEETTLEGDVMCFPEALSRWFELSYAEFLTIPRLVLESMPEDWQRQMANLLFELDATFDWRPKEGRYWVKLKDDHGRFTEAPLGDYRRGNIEHLRKKSKRRDNGK